MREARVGFATTIAEVGDIAPARASPAALVFVAATAIICIVLIWLQVDGLNGPLYWQWHWRHLKPLHTAFWLAPPLLPLIGAMYLGAREARSGASTILPLALLMIAAFGLQLCGALSRVDGLDHVRAIVMSPVATSYFTDALNLGDVRAWLAAFDTSQRSLHASTHPPGPILYYAAWLALMPPATAALVGGLVLGAAGTLAIPLLYLFVGQWTRDRRERFAACALYALVPAFVVFLPEFDQLYPVFTLLLAILWLYALRGRRGAALASGVVLAVAAFFAYNLLVLGAWLVLTGAWTCHGARWQHDTWRTVASAALLALGAFVTFYALLWLTTGYDAFGSLRQALATQQAIANVLDRPWRATFVFDLYDFALGAGLLAVALLLLFARHAQQAPVRSAPQWALPLIGLATIAIVDVSGLLRAETARTWMFLQPFAIAPVASELVRFDARGRSLIFVLQWLVLLTLFCKMSFVEP